MLQRAIHSLRSSWPFHGKKEEIAFHASEPLTLGVEIELQIIDPKTYNLVPKAEELLKAGVSFKKLKPEFFLDTVEINTAKCWNVQEVERDLSRSFDMLESLGEKVGVQFATTGCHPFSRYNECVITPTPRYHELNDRNQWLIRRMTVYGLHIHMGMVSGHDCIRFHNFFLHFLPHLLALSASSPYWQGEDTGLAACRPSTYEALPTAGQPYPLRDWQEFESLYHSLRACDAIHSLKDLWWDMRPSPGYGTLEIRVCDGLATLAEAAAVTAYVHLLAHWFHDNGDWINQVPPPTLWVARENKWRVMRHGLEAMLVKNAEGITRTVRDDISEWLGKLEPYAVKYGYGSYLEILSDILTYGNSSQRQRAIFAQKNSLEKIVAFNMDEFHRRAPLWRKSNSNIYAARKSAA